MDPAAFEHAKGQPFSDGVPGKGLGLNRNKPGGLWGQPGSVFGRPTEAADRGKGHANHADKGSSGGGNAGGNGGGN